MSDELMLSCSLFAVAGGLYAAFAGSRRKEEDNDRPIRLADGWWLPKAKTPPPPAPAAPPERPSPPANLRIKLGVIPTAEEVLTRRPAAGTNAPGGAVMELDVASYRRVAERWSTKEEDINPSTAAVLMLQMCSEIERLQKADYEFQEKLADGITDAFLEGRWIPVSERLPEEESQCIVWHKRSGECRIAFRYEGNWYEGSILITANVTHWAPLPAPPDAKP